MSGNETARPLVVLHTDAGRLSSTVRQMKWDIEHDTPIPELDTHAISVESGKKPSQMSKEEAKIFYLLLCGELLAKYPELYESIFR
jgi:hypothetical protein